MNRIDSMLGLAAKAGRLKSGLYLCEEAIKKGKAYLVIVSEDAKTNTVKTLKDKCGFYHVPMRQYGTKNSLGDCIGKELRSCIVVTDKGFAEHIIKLIDERQDCSKGVME